MFPIAGRTAGPNELKFFGDPNGRPGGFIGKKKNRNFFFQHFFSTGNAGPFS